MELALQVGVLLVWLPLNLLVISALLRGEYKHFPFVFAYAVAEFLAVAAEIQPYWAVYTHGRTAESLQVFVYWMDEALLQILVFAVVISLIYRASARTSSRRVLRVCIIGGSLVFAGVSFLVHYSPASPRGMWMTPWMRDLNFGAALLDLALWFLLIASREKDLRLLLLSGALGIQFTGEAIGEAVRELAKPHRSHPLAFFGGLLVVIADIARSYIWWRVFQKASRSAPTPVPASTTTGD